ncbi:hypothetical protein AcW1_002220 [Taiwanofungus camphoratus]|nr:hypothetical protein AcW1_002220 [Antrodia cinnamomea]KAI0946197.1 hypothetical protein AcV7_010234 [Antrodia cinnamomea]
MITTSPVVRITQSSSSRHQALRLPSSPREQHWNQRRDDKQFRVRAVSAFKGKRRKRAYLCRDHVLPLSARITRSVSVPRFGEDRRVELRSNSVGGSAIHKHQDAVERLPSTLSRTLNTAL